MTCGCARSAPAPACVNASAPHISQQPVPCGCCSVGGRRMLFLQVASSVLPLPCGSCAEIRLEYAALSRGQHSVSTSHWCCAALLPAATQGYTVQHALLRNQQ